jgi:endonuclease/exonuclease/phosphatase family metal-dependent hydrolase
MIAILVLLGAFGTFLIYAVGPAVSAREFPPSGVVKFFEPRDGPGSPLSKIRLVTYNIGYASGDKNNLPVSLSKEEVQRNLAAMAERLSEFNPDVVCLQEVDFRASRTFQINEMEFLAKALNLPYGAYAVTWNKRYLPWPYWPPQHQFGRIVSGQAILSRFPIELQDLLKFEKPESNAFWYNWFYLDRIVQKVLFQVGSQKVWLWNIHLEAFQPATRLRQAQRLADWVKGEESPFRIAAGDYNSVSEFRGELSEKQKKQLEDGGEALNAFLKASGFKNAEGSPPFFTMPSWDAFKKIDQILYDPKGFRLDRTGTTPGLTASDHLPVWSARIIVGATTQAAPTIGIHVCIYAFKNTFSSSIWFVNHSSIFRIVTTPTTFSPSMMGM